ncbi:hypothetical protein WN51_11965 [Melipona quadrifasciata]|uniref:Uncharacterized protein n=1 Tax=Melipona quadrifasciata TaxID=166423 RepID=A0A0M9A305_9HYME|nr:hypothetical protein WN51_11965 [Melipona quadrifasciata]
MKSVKPSTKLNFKFGNSKFKSESQAIQLNDDLSKIVCSVGPIDGTFKDCYERFTLLIIMSFVLDKFFFGTLVIVQKCPSSAIYLGGRCKSGPANAIPFTIKLYNERIREEVKFARTMRPYDSSTSFEHFDVKQNRCGNTARMGGPSSLAGVVITTSVWEDNRNGKFWKPENPHTSPQSPLERAIQGKNRTVFETVEAEYQDSKSISLDLDPFGLLLKELDRHTPQSSE